MTIRVLDKRRGWNLERIRRECEQKRRFTNEREAKAFAKRFRRDKGGPLQVTYECPWCGGWHLSLKRATKSRRG